MTKLRVWQVKTAERRVTISLASVRTKAAIAAERSMAKQFVALCEREGVPEPMTQHRFDGERKRTMDYCWWGYRIALEVDGGLFVKGAHARGARIAKTHEKLNAAAIAGWRILFVQPKQLLTLDTIRLVKQALGIA